MKQCDLVLEGCPNKCGVTVERQDMQKHLENECMNLRRPTGTLQVAPLHSATSLQTLDFNPIPSRQDFQYNSQQEGTFQEWNDKVVAALMVIKKAILNEENERIRAEAEWKVEFKKLNQRLQNSEGNARNSLLPQVTLIQFHELKEEVLLLKESLLEEKQRCYQLEQQLAYETEKSILLSQQIVDLNERLQEYTDRNEAWKFGHEDEVNKMLEEITLERQQRLRAAELKMEAAKLEDLCYSIELWRTEDKGERNKLEDQCKRQENDCKQLVDQQNSEIEELRNDIAKYSKHIG
ncbi:hypothetical protein L9F63_014200 [Diploptera punctata]|uniref:TRAF-type domain-containing protein n=1 Tax=Diploptera punctata TaxID=6984 RepID=A0AAD8A9S5_DIPPU|nr:hypothetical protein L9F63_014200 [Diploptera punctata]